MTFLLNCAVSVLTGTSFGTAATMGVICTAIGNTLGIPILFTGGAILSGAFFGDRCSPVSTSALLVSELTSTSIFDNLHSMVRSSAVPFSLSCILYILTGIFLPSHGYIPDLEGIFNQAFRLHWISLVPALVILVLAVCRINVKLSMGASILAALPVCILIQHCPVSSLPHLLLFGYQAPLPEVSALLNGGGIGSMVKVGTIVCISASYSGIFQQTGLLDRPRKLIQQFSKRTAPYAAMLLTSTFTSMIACNQSLSIMLSHELCRNNEPNRQQLALDLEDSAVVVSPLIPWSIAGAVPLASVGAPPSSIVLALFLWLLPLWRLSRSIIYSRKMERMSS